MHQELGGAAIGATVLGELVFTYLATKRSHAKPCRGLFSTHLHTVHMGYAESCLSVIRFKVRPVDTTPNTPHSTPFLPSGAHTCEYWVRIGGE